MSHIKYPLPRHIGKDPALQAIISDYRRLVEEREETSLHPKAALSRQHKRPYGDEDDHRLPYKRDVDRIVHSKAYARYSDKTQVVYLVDNDHIAHRSLHVQLVSNFARGIAEILRLNLDLVEAISLGHDVGHPPFGHEGEGYLCELSRQYGHTPFVHSYHSCRLFAELETLNLGEAVYDGFLCHDGGMRHNSHMPRFGKTWQEHLEDCAEKLADPESSIIPGTLEGCLVKLCDTASYVGKDLEDAIALKIIGRDQLPDTFLGKSNREILSTLACDIIRTSYEQEYIGMSEEAFEALKVLRRFNFTYIYTCPRLKVESSKIKESYRLLFDRLLTGYEREKEESWLWRHYLSSKSLAYVEKTPPVQLVIDFIAGMTDRYFVSTLQKMFIPSRIPWE